MDLTVVWDGDLVDIDTLPHFRTMVSCSSSLYLCGSLACMHKLYPLRSFGSVWLACTHSLSRSESTQAEADRQITRCARSSFSSLSVLKFTLSFFHFCFPASFFTIFPFMPRALCPQPLAQTISSRDRVPVSVSDTIWASLCVFGCMTIVPSPLPSDLQMQTRPGLFMCSRSLFLISNHPIFSVDECRVFHLQYSYQGFTESGQAFVLGSNGRFGCWCKSDTSQLSYLTVSVSPWKSVSSVALWERH